MKKLRKIGVVLCALVIGLSFTACGGSGSYSSYSSKSDNAAPASYSAEEAYVEGEYGYDDYSNGTGTQMNQDKFQDNRKLIKTYNLDVETEDFDGFMAALEAKVYELSGYFESINTYNGSRYSMSGKALKNSSLTIRIPASNGQAMLDMLGEKANITNQSLSVDDVTLSYVDIESRKKTYEAELDRLLQFLESAETIEDMITVEDRITELRYMLESMESQLRTYDNKVDYTTFYLSINEVQIYTEPDPETYGERLGRSFKDGLNNVIDGFKNFLVGFLGALPGLVVFAVVVLAIFFIVRAIVRASKKKEAKKRSEAYAQYQAQMQAMNAQAQKNAANAENSQKKAEETSNNAGDSQDKQ